MDRLSHLFESSAKIVDLPKEFKAAQFTSPGSKLQINQVAWIEPKEGEIVVKVSSCGLHSTDKIAKHALLPHVKYPFTPGSNVVGECVQVGKNVKHFKPGHPVVGVAAHGCLAEYAVLNADYVAELKRKEGATVQSFVEVFEGGRVEAELGRFEREEKDLSRDEARRRIDANERLGFHGTGIDVVIGDGGAARVAVQVLKHSSAYKERRVLVISTTDRWNFTFYDVEAADHLQLTHNELGSALKAVGGIRFAVAVTQPPQEGFEELLEAMRYGSEMVVLAPHHENKLSLPIAPICAKAISIRGAVWPSRQSLEKVLDLVHTHDLHVSVNRYKFDSVEELNNAWDDLEKQAKFDQPLIVLRETIQAQETH
ncbi:hypothetical protein JCM16303_005659 [Sporobolomyces ruberrimus]